MYTKYLPTFMIAVAVTILVLLTYPFLAPVAMASIVAVLLSPIQDRLHKKFPKVPAKLVSSLCVLLFALLVMTPLGFILVKSLLTVGSFFSELNSNNDKITEVGTQRAHQIFAYAEQVMQSIQQTVGIKIDFDPLQWVRGALGKVGAWIVASMTVILSGAPALFLDIFIFILSLYYFLVEGDLLYQKAASYFKLPSAKVERIATSFKEACRSIVLTNIATGVIQSVLVVIGAAITGFDDLLLIGTITFLFSFIPVVGAAPSAFVLALLQFSQGDNTDGLILIVTGLISGSIDNIIRPAFLSGQSTMHPLISFISIVGGITLMGLPGLFLGPILLQVSFVIIEIYK